MSGPRVRLLTLIAALVLPVRADLGKADRLLLHHGLQLQGMVTRDDLFHLATYQAAGYTSIHWLWDSDPAKMGDAPGFPWSRWVGDETRMPPLDGEPPYLGNLISLQLADEWHLNQPDVRDRAVAWFNAVREKWPEVILYANNYGGQVDEPSLLDFVARARPDMLSFDTYPWRSDYTTRQPIEGPPTGWYGEIGRFRRWAVQAGVPFASYVQTFHAVQDYDQKVYRDPSPSELRLNHFAALAFGAKVLIDFTYNTGASSLFVKPGGDSHPTPLFEVEADINRRARNLGSALVRLRPVEETSGGHLTGVVILRGKLPDGTPTPVPMGFVADPDTPDGCTDWVAGRNDPYLQGWTVTNLGRINGGRPGDVILSWFAPLDGQGDAAERYLMVVNGLTSARGTAANCAQQIRLDFDAELAALELVAPATGRMQRRALPVLGGRRRLVLELDGGDAAVLKLGSGTAFVAHSSDG